MLPGSSLSGSFSQLKHFGKGDVPLTLGPRPKLHTTYALARASPTLDPRVDLEFNANFMDTAGVRCSSSESAITFHARVGGETQGAATSITYELSTWA